MKKQKRFMMLLMSIVLMLFSLGTKAESYSCRITNSAQVSCNMFEFDIVIQRTGSTAVYLAMFQAGININPAIIPAGATINVSVVPGSSQLTANMQPTPPHFTFDASKNCIILTPMSPAIANKTTISNAPAGTKICRVRVACSQPFNVGATSPTWSWSTTTGYPTKVFAYIGSTNTDITVQATHYLIGTYSTTLTNSFVNVPVAKTISTDMTQVCANPGVGATITVANTQSGLAYYLYKDGVPIGTPSAVVFGQAGTDQSFTALQTNGVFTVKVPSCSGMVDMANSVTVVGQTPLDQHVTISPDPASILSGDITFTTNTVNAAPGNWFDWYVNGVNQNVYDPTFTYTPALGDYVYADMNSDGSMCISQSTQLTNSQTVHVYVGNPPVVQTLSGDASICLGATSVVTLGASEVGFDYQLYKGAVAFGAAQAGNGNPLTWNVTDAATYTCKVVWPATDMAGTATITTNPILTPTFAAVAAVCAGGTLAPLPTTSLNLIEGTWAPAINNMVTTLYTFTPNAGQCGTVVTKTITINQPVVPTFNQVAAICAGGTLAPLPTTSVNSVPGTWAPAMNNMATTEYTFTPTAGICATTATMTITVNQPVQPTFAQVGAICAGGSLAPLPTTSIEGVTGTWAPALNNMATTQYTFTPTAGLCALTATMTITVNQPVQPTFAQVAAICEGGSLAPLPLTSIEGVTGTWAPALNNMATTQYTFTPTAGLCALTATMTITVNAPVQPTFAQVAAICAGGTLAPLPTSSIEGVTGTWAPALNNMATTLYTFTPTAGLCALPATMTITVNAPVQPTFAQVAAICEGGSLAPLPTASIEGVNGTWAPALNNMATTLYTFTPANGECALTATMTITVNQPTVPTFAQVAPICAGGTLAALPTTSINGVTGTWAPALNNMATTQYTFTPTAGLCATTATMTIVVNQPTVPTFAQVAPICAGASLAALPTTSLNDVEGTWAPALNNLATTEYTFTPDAGFCATTATMTIVVNPYPAAAGAITGTNLISSLPANAVAYSIGAVNHATSYVWSYDGTGVTINGTGTAVTLNFALGATAGTLHVYGVNACGNGVESILPIAVNGLPDAPLAYNVLGSGSYCQGNAGLAISLDGSQSGVSYELLNGTTVMATVAGTGSALPFGIYPFGTYTITGTNAGGTTTMNGSAVITETPLTTPTFGQVAAICAGSSLSALPTTSNNGISGTWAPALNNQATTEYTFTPAAGQCASTATMTIVVNPSVTPTFAPVAAICAGSTLAPLPTSSIEGVTGTWAPALNNMATTQYTFTPAAGQCATIAHLTITVNALTTPTFTQLGPYVQNSVPGTLPLVSNNGITGTWAPAVVSTAVAGSAVYTFTPAAGQCATVAHMTIQTLADAWTFNGDIGTTVTVFWPSTVNAANYALQYRPFGSTGAYIGIGSTTSNVKVGNLIPGQHYEFRVRAYLASGSPTGGFKTADYTTIPTTYVKSMDMGTASQIAWDDYSPWASTYVFQYKKHSASSWTNVPCYVPYSKINTDLGVAYDVQVIVYHAGLMYGTTAVYAFTPNAFTSSVANNTGTALDLTWTNFDLNNPAPWVTTQYLKYRVAGSSNPWGVKLVAGGINTSHITNLTANTNYEFTVSVYLPAYWGITPVSYFSTSTSKELAVTNHDVNIYPNPFVDKVNMDLFTEQGTTVTWNIYDMTGKVVLSGSQSITSGYSTLNIDAANLSKGVYMLNAIMNDKMQSFRIMKQ